MRNQYQIKLDALREQHRIMLALSEESLRYVHLHGHSKSLVALELIVKQLVALEKDIFHSCEMLILKEQPVAQDLEFIIRTMRQILDLRRIGELSLKSVKIIVEIPESCKLLLLEQMAHLLCAMFSSFKESHFARVEEIEDKMDSYFRQIKTQIAQNMQDSYKNAHWWCEILMLSKYFEKIADHISAMRYAQEV